MDIKSYDEFMASLNANKKESAEDILLAKFEASNQSIDEFLSSINESAFKRILGGLSGLAFGRLIGKMIIKALGLKPNGVLGKILLSRAVHIAIGAAFGKR